MKVYGLNLDIFNKKESSKVEFTLKGKQLTSITLELFFIEE